MRNRINQICLLLVMMAAVFGMANPVPLFPGFAIVNADSAHPAGNIASEPTYIGDTVVSTIGLHGGTVQFSISIDELCSGKIQYAPLPEWFAVWAGLPMAQSYIPSFVCSLYTGTTFPAVPVGYGNASNQFPIDRSPYLVRFTGDVRSAESLFIRIIPMSGLNVWRFTASAAPTFSIGQCTPSIWVNGAYGVCAGDTIQTNLYTRGFIGCTGVSLSLDSGNTWRTITPFRITPTSFSWVPPDTSTYRAVIRCVGAPPGYDSAAYRDTALAPLVIVKHGTRPGVDVLYSGNDLSFCHACTTGPAPDSTHAFTDSTWARFDSLDFDNVDVFSAVVAADAAGGTHISVEIRRDSLNGVIILQGELPRNNRRTMFPVTVSLKGIHTIFIRLVSDTAATAQLRLLGFLPGQAPLASVHGRLVAATSRQNKTVWTTQGYRTTTIFYTVSIRGSVRIALRDMNGRIIRSLSSGYAETGIHSIIWNRRNDHGAVVVPGVYILETSGASGMTNTLVHVAR